MKSREEKQQKTDKAWNELYARLEQDGLLPQADAPVKQHFMQSVPLRWAACIALLLNLKELLILFGKNLQENGIS